LFISIYPKIDTSFCARCLRNKNNILFELKCNLPLAGRSRTFQRMNALSSIPSCTVDLNHCAWLVYLTWKDCKLSSYQLANRTGTLTDSTCTVGWSP